MSEALEGPRGQILEGLVGPVGREQRGSHRSAEEGHHLGVEELRGGDVGSAHDVQSPQTGGGT